MKKPNFFILGAPKCGTTSLAHWLALHPQIFVSPVKEPFYFNTDDQARVRFSFREYEALFAGAGAEHVAVGEASTWYLHSAVAVTAILNYSDRPKFIVMVRNPVEMAYSLHEQEIFSGQENEPIFRKAWSLQGQREKGRSIPKGCIEPKRLQYGWACSLGTHLQRVLREVPEGSLHVIVLDDLKENPRTAYLGLLDFLGVEDDGRMEFPTLNSAKVMRSRPLQKLLRLGSATKKRLGVYRSFGLTKFNHKRHVRTPLSSDFKEELLRYFEPEIVILEDLLSRDLSSWRKC